MNSKWFCSFVFILVYGWRVCLGRVTVPARARTLSSSRVVPRFPPDSYRRPPTPTPRPGRPSALVRRLSRCCVRLWCSLSLLPRVKTPQRARPTVTWAFEEFPLLGCGERAGRCPGTRVSVSLGRSLAGLPALGQRRPPLFISTPTVNGQRTPRYILVLSL